MTPAAARARARRELAALAHTVTRWDEAVLDQAVLHLADLGQPFGMNDIRQLVPEDACTRAGLHFQALIHTAGAVHHVGYVTSINPRAKGKPVGTYLLTTDGRDYLLARRGDRRIAGRAA
ncbi:hypothetical protein [Streptomyces uncialis]|uniref:Uncharacterized protein n=1 Tax=Streptomyces uncialis TaxID=1048205 RepID=A0A1Q4V0Q0_9ACTN|nr:hypothetical protein [Streptomyces uncialis]OKH91462.1 hypothetical protein AB852_28275 [Streptomyces uncialis]